MFKLPPSNRLDFWKSFRSQLNDLPLFVALGKTQELWDTCPFTPYYLDPENAMSWPDPWQLLIENYYCDLAKTLGILYTIYFTDHRRTLAPEIRIYYDYQTKYSYHVAWLCQGKYVLNLVEGEIVNKEHINQQLKLTHRYTATDLKLEQY